MSNPMTCALRGEQWVAGNVSVDRTMYFLKVFCVPPHKLSGNMG
jgi:hypothetical protein